MEQLSIGIRYVETAEERMVIHEEFLGFSALGAMNAEAISKEILNKAEEYGLDLQKLIGQGCDGCSTLAGEVSGVQKRIRKIYPKAYFVHCASHRLNLVINDQNNVMEIRNAVGVIKAIIAYFRKSPLRRRLVLSHIPLLCETRWSEKYKSIRLFYDNFHEIFTKLKEIVEQRNCSSESRQKAYQLIHSISNTRFLICMTIIAKYSAMFEPVAKKLQAINSDIYGARNQINSLMSVITSHEENAEEVFQTDIFAKVEKISDEILLELRMPRTTFRQRYRTIIRTSSVQEYFRQAIFIPYLDSIQTSLRTRFDDSQFIPGSLLMLHPSGAGTFFRQGGLKIVRSCQRLGGEAPQTPLFSNARF